jgi:M6 family metalloprotease-like protein/uncharacterized repeat protein (TIGR02543 family)
MKKEKIFTVILLAFLLFMAPVLNAVPAKPYPSPFTQPNGETLTIMIKGDERIHWSETLDGYTLLYNQEKYLTYAQLDEDENLQPSDIIATDIEKRDIATLAFLNTIEKKLGYSDTQKQVLLKIWQIEDDAAEKYNSRGTTDVIGQFKTLCAFVQFPEKAMVKTMDQFENLFNQLGYTGNGTGSVRDFFKEASYNKFDLIITACGIYTAPKSESYYAGPPGDGTLHCDELARWLAQQVAADPDINFADYDSNGDGKVDGFHFIFAGYGQEAFWGSNTLIWSHSWDFFPSVCKNGKCISVYSCSPELCGSSGTQIADIGTICHEMSHAFGAADYYDTNYGSGGQYNGTGTWDLMAEGCDNGNGNRPAHQNMYIKIQFGWVTPVVLNEPVTITNMLNSTDNPVAYRINTGNGNEHYLLENIQKTGFNTGVPGSGLLIYHAHNNVGFNGINDTHPQRMYPVCASSTVAIPVAGAANYGNISSAGCTFPGSSSNTEFTSTSTPRMFYWTNTPVNKPITDVKQNNCSKSVSFKFMGGSAINYYPITASCDENGTITPLGTTQVLEGESQHYQITPDTHYYIKTVLVNCVNNTNAVNTGVYDFTDVTSEQTIHATFAPKIYTVTFDANGGTGTMNPQNFSYGILKNLLPNKFTRSGYTFINWNTKEDGEGTCYSDQQNLSLSEDITLYAQWEANSFVIMATATEGGEISPNGEVYVSVGESQTFTITTEENYEIIYVLVDDENLGAVSEFTFENVTASHTIHAVFQLFDAIEKQDLTSVQVCPNPTTGELRMEMGEWRILNVEVFDIYGKNLEIPRFAWNDERYEIQSQADGVVINISHLQAGIYFLRMQTNQGTITKKIIKI